MAGDDFPDDSEIGFIVEGSLVAGVCFVGCVAGVVFVRVVVLLVVWPASWP